MSTLHIFNPEHDISLANGMRKVTPPHAARQLRHDLGFIPALWANEGDMVLVDDYACAYLSYMSLRKSVKRVLGLDISEMFFVESSTLSNLMISDVEPWGWDYSLKSSILPVISDKDIIPSDHYLSTVRELSHREVSARLLKTLRFNGTTGEALACSTHDEAVAAIYKFGGHAVVKAPWSSSGRGIRFINGHIDEMLSRWIKNVLTKQQKIMVESQYRRIIDFGMEFYSQGNGKASYCGLSLFSTTNGAYTGNLLATENRKREIISRYVSLDLLDKVRDKVCSFAFSPITSHYTGPFGIDMMIVAPNNHNGYLLHPCVEINLRRTMGHLALCLTPADDDIQGLMQIVYEDKFRLRISNG